MVSDDLRKIITGDVSADEASLKEASHDASIFELTPQAVVFPRSVHDIQTVVQYVNSKKLAGENISITARAAGTDMSGGPLTTSLVLSFTKHLNRIKEIGEDYAVVEPGVFYRDLEKELDERGLFFPSYPASKNMCALGGMLANNAGGEKTLAYGKTAKYVEQLKAVFADGKEYVLKPLKENELKEKMLGSDFEAGIYKKIHKLLEDNFDLIQKAKPHVSKNSAGYALWDAWDRKTFDLTKIFVGSQGTLGMITEGRIKLLKKKPFTKLVVVFMRDLKVISEFVPEVLKVHPESLESYDRHTLKLAMQFAPDLLKVLKNETIFSLALGFLPEVWMAIKGGLPNLIVMVEIAGEDEDDVERRAEQVMKEAKIFGLPAHITKSEREANRFWAIRRESFNLLRKRVRGKQTAPFIDDIIVPPLRLPEFLPKLDSILNQYSKYFTYTVAGHIGDGNFHIIPLMDLNDEDARKIIPVLSDEVYDLVLKFGGSITAEHNDGLIRSPYLPKMFGAEIMRLFEEVKNIFDPKGIFNPGKKVHASMDFALRHIKHPMLAGAEPHPGA